MIAADAHSGLLATRARADGPSYARQMILGRMHHHLLPEHPPLNDAATPTRPAQPVSARSPRSDTIRE